MLELLKTLFSQLGESQVMMMMVTMMMMTMTIFFSVRFKPGTAWSSPTSRRSASRGDLPRWNKVGKSY